MPDVDLSEFEALSNPKNGRPCLVAVALGKLNAGERAKLTAALAEDQSAITNAAISKWLETRGHEVHFMRIVSHRKGSCRCGRD